MIAFFTNTIIMTNLEIIKSTYEGKSAEENAKNLAKYSDKNIVWTETKGFLYGGTYIGFEDIVENVFKRLSTEWIDYKIEIEDYLAENDKVIAYGTYSGIYKKTNKYFEARVVYFFKLKNGKIISFEQFVDSKTVDQATR